MGAEQRDYFCKSTIANFLLLSVIVISFVSESISPQSLLSGERLNHSYYINNAMSRTREAKDELRVLFVGNSFTYTNDLPAIVAALAEATGQKQFTYKSIAFPDFSLEDHWQQGEARKAIAEKRWDFVVMQQGPSALPESRTLLLEYARRFDGFARIA